jgi:hypothetical protein
MSEHVVNTQALLHASLPQLLPIGHRVGVDIQLQVMPKANVMLLPPHRMRTTATGMIEILAGDPEEWRPAPQGADVCELGKPLPPEKCDVVAILGTVVEQMFGTKLLSGDGKAAHGRATSGPLAVIARIPLSQWQQ